MKTEFEDFKNSIDMDGYNTYLVEKEKGKGSGDTTLEMNQIKTRLAKIDKELATEKERSGTLESQRNSALITNEIGKAFAEHNVDPAHITVLSSHFKGRASVEVFGDDISVTMDKSGDGSGLPVKEFFKSWVETDEGKTYLAKPDHKGVNRGRFSGNGTGTKITREEWSALPPSEQAKTANDPNILIID